jgi:diguanylate cyclase (GGDEF)-like protein
MAALRPAAAWRRWLAWPRPLLPGLVLLLLLLLAGLNLAVAAGAPAARVLQLEDASPRVSAWPVLTQLADAEGRLGLAEVRAALPQFGLPTTATNTLGHRRDAVWLRLPLQVADNSDGQWLLDVDYAMLNRVDVWLLDAQGGVLQQARLGNLQHFDERPVRTRSHAWMLNLQPGTAYELMLRVQTQGGMMVPITLNKPTPFWQRAQAEQMLQGLLTGLGLCLVLYSLAQWVTSREPLFIKYVLLIGSGVLFSLVQFGIGAQYLWPGSTWPDLHLPGMAALGAAAGAALFIEEALAHSGRKPWFARSMQSLAAALLAVALLFALDLVDVHFVSAVVGTLGLMPAVMGAPGAWRVARRGDPVGWLFLLAWVGYFTATAITVSVIKGRMEANFWTLHAFQFVTTLDMVLFLRVLSLRMHAVHAAAQQAAREAEVLRSLAETDPLTGLPNRRGLHRALQAALPHSSAERPLALFMLDLDGFKLVNDRHGHDVGDLLLMAVAERLRTLVREDDVVARLGGDEFIVLVQGLKTEAQARDLGHQLIVAFSEPFVIDGLQCFVGTSAGYVMSPGDGDVAGELLKLADAAMYRAKLGGKGRVLRGMRLAV